MGSPGSECAQMRPCENSSKHTDKYIPIPASQLHGVVFARATTATWGIAVADSDTPLLLKGSTSKGPK